MHLLIALFVLMILNLTAVAHAGNILYYVDHAQGTDQMHSALDYYAAAGVHTYTKLTDASQYASMLTNGTADGDVDLGIIMVQKNSSSSTDIANAINALGGFAQQGGLSIYTDWTRNNQLAGLFDVTWLTSADAEKYGNHSSMNLTNAQFAMGMSGAVPVTVGFHDPNRQNQDQYNMSLAGGTPAATFTGQDSQGSFTHNAIALGNEGRSITNGMLTDTFDDPEEGKQLYINEIGYLLPAGSSVPEPATMVLFGSGLVGFFVKKRRS